MKRRKLLAALAGWLAIPALASAQTDGPRFTKVQAPTPLSASAPTRLPEPGLPVINENAVDPKAKQPAAEIVVPRKVEGKPTVTVEEMPYDPRPYNQRWLRRRGSVVEEGPESPARFVSQGDANYRVWFVPEWIVWKTTGMHVPPLVTGSSAGADQTDAGVIGAGDTRMLFGNESQAKSFRTGFRARAGFWLDSTQTLGVEASMFYLGQKSKEAFFNTSGDPNSVARPFFDVLNGRPSAEAIAFATVNADGTPNSTISGALFTRVTTDLWGADINLRRYLTSTDSIRVDGLLGFRYQRLRDTLETTSSSTINVDGAIGDLSAGTVLRVQDLFHTTSNFYGGQLGLAAEWQTGRWSVGLTGKLALGMVQHEVRINGLTTITPPIDDISLDDVVDIGDLPSIAVPGAPQVTSGGLLAQGTNIGRHRTSRFSVIPELSLNVGYQLSSNVRIFAGYSLLYWSNVVRPGDQIDLTVNTTQVQRSTGSAATLAGPPRPAYNAAFRESGLWAHGGSLGLELRW